MKTETLQEIIKHIEDLGQDLDSVSWGMQEGVLISVNDAKSLLKERGELIEALKRALNDFKKGTWTDETYDLIEGLLNNR